MTWRVSGVQQVRRSFKMRFDALAAAKPMALLIAARVLLLTCTFASALIASWTTADDAAEHVTFLFPAIGILYVLSFLSGAWLLVKGNGKLFTWLQIGIDTATITGVVYITGGPGSPFLFLYIPPVIIASMMASREMALTLSLLNGICYSTLCFALSKGWILTAEGNYLQEELPAGSLILQMIGLGSAMVLVAVLTSFLCAKIRHHTELIEQANSKLLKFSTAQRALIADFPEGLITTDAEGIINDVNRRAVELLGPKALEMTLRPLPGLLDKLKIGHPKEEVTHAQWENFEFAMEINSEVRQLRLVRRPMFRGDGMVNGYMFIVQDVTALRSAEEQLHVQETMAKLLATRPEEQGPLFNALPEFVGESPRMKDVFSLIRRVAPSDATILITGESGTGKELVARSIHRMSERANKAFVALNCGAMPENLIESELFGHRRGAFTGADSDHTGLFRQADHGTIFLDEIGELPLHLQAKLLRALQEKRVRPVGSDKDIPVDVRIIAATNKTLKEEVEKGTFREDLFYRLNVISITLPALRDRKEDLMLLANSILRRLVGEDKLPVFAPSTLQLLRDYNYPGNVRELENILERAVVLGGEVLLPEHLPEAVRQTTPTLPSIPFRGETAIIEDESLDFPVKLDELLDGLEKRYLLMALEKSRGAKKRAAELLGINFRSLRYRLQKFGLGADLDD